MTSEVTAAADQGSIGGHKIDHCFHSGSLSVNSACYRGLQDHLWCWCLRPFHKHSVFKESMYTVAHISKDLHQLVGELNKMKCLILMMEVKG